jgi:N-glycosylase/DNA lyase
VEKEILEIYNQIGKDIKKRLEEFENKWKKGNNKDIHLELSFCILTPQSKARSAWEAIEALRENELIWNGAKEEIAEYLNKVRFKNTKADNLVRLREQMTDINGEIVTKDFFESLGEVEDKRNWIVKNVRGMSYKEASHFLRNVGFGKEIAILDRHILRNMERLGIIDEIPKTITPKKYLEMEKKLLEYTKKIKIPMDHIDLLFWYREAGEIFK